MERPKEWAGKDHLTDAELEQLKRDISQVYDKTGDAIFQIVQSPDTIGILQETIHDVRIVPLDGRTHRRIAWRPEMRHRQLDADCGADHKKRADHNKPTKLVRSADEPSRKSCIWWIAGS